MAAMKAKAIVTATNGPMSAPLNLSSDPFIIRRLNLQNRPLDQDDKTTKLVLLWQALGDEVSTFQRRTWNFAMVHPDGSVEVVDPDGLEREISEMHILEAQKAKVEAAIRRIIEIGGQYFHELQNTAYAYSGTESHNIRRLDVCSRNLTIENKDLAPDQIIKLPDYLNLKEELDAETKHANEVLEQARAKIAIYEKAFQDADI
jgi:hypothetical protein